MKNIFPALTMIIGIFSSFPVYSQENVLPSIATCIEQDWLSIEDLGSSQAIVIYSNSRESCSSEFDEILTAPNGISVHVFIDTGSSSDPGETITLIPTDPSYWAIPPQAYMLDNSKKQEFIIQGGMS